MPIRYVDRRVFLGSVPATLDSVQGLLQGTHVQPPGRTGLLTSQFGGVTASIIGGFTPGANRTGQIVSTLGGVGADFIGISAASGASFGVTYDSGYSGPATIAEGQPFTVAKSGGGFGVKPGGGLPLLYMPYASNLLPDAAYSRDATAGIFPSESNHYSFSSGEHPPNSTGCVDVAQNDTDGSAAVEYKWATPTNKIFVMFSRKVTPDFRTWTNSPYAANFKQIRARASINSGVPNTYFISGPTSEGSWAFNSDTSGGLVYHETGIGPSYMPGGFSTAVYDSLGANWHSMRATFRASTSSGAADGQAILNVNGARVFYYPETPIPNPSGTDRASSGFRTRNGDASFVGWDKLAMAQCSNQTSSSPIPPNAHIYYGPTIVDDSLCQLIVSDSPTWNTSQAAMSVEDFFIPVVWSDGSITLVPRRGIHSTLTGRYLYAVLLDGVTALRLLRFS